jgi:hypothetical protein
MSLRKGSLEEYYNSGPGAESAGCRAPKPGDKPTCYKDKVEPDTRAKLALYANPQDAPKQA